MSDDVVPSLVTDGGRDHLTLNVRGSDDVAIVENALEAVAADRDAELNTGRGQPTDGQMTRGEALVELARAYTGWPIEQEVSDGR